MKVLLNIVKFLTFLTILSLPLRPVYADEYLDSVSEMLSTIKGNLGFYTNTSGVHDSIIQRYIREEAMKVAVATRAIQLVDTVVAVRGQDWYTIDSLILKVTAVTFNKGADSVISLRFLNSEEWDSVYPAGIVLRNQTKFSARPSRYDWFYRTLKLFPPPWIANDTFIVEGIGRPDSMYQATQTWVRDIPLQFRPLIVNLATVRTAASIKMWPEVQFYREEAISDLQLYNINLTVPTVVNENK